VIRVIRSAYSGLRGSNCHSLNSLQCVVFTNIAVSQNRLQISAKKSISIQFDFLKKFDFDLRFHNRNISITSSVIQRSATGPAIFDVNAADLTPATVFTSSSNWQWIQSSYIEEFAVVSVLLTYSALMN